MTFFPAMTAGRLLRLIAATTLLTGAIGASNASAQGWVSMGTGQSSFSHDHSSTRARQLAVQPAQIQTTFDLMAARLALMPNVAKAKYNSGAPITDPEREKKLNDKVTWKGLALGLDPRISRRFFQGQIAAAKEVQVGLIDQWRRKHRPPFNDVPPMETQRVAIDDVTNQLLHALVGLRAVTEWQGGTVTLRQAAEAYLQTPAGRTPGMRTAMQPVFLLAAGRL